MSEVICQTIGLRFAWEGEAEVLRGVDLKVRRGDLVLISGESGRGKSTLLRLLVGLESPLPGADGSCRGQVHLFGEDIWSMPRTRLRELRMRSGFVFQNSALISNMSVRDNIAIPLRYHTALPVDQVDARVQRWIDALLLSGHENKRPAMLSLGMQRRAALARAMVLEPEILFLDEPTAGLDVRNSDIMLSLIGNLRTLGDASIVMVTHDLQAANQLGGHIALLLEGRLRRPRPWSELLDSTDPLERELIRTSVKEPHE